jgi:hypothetical protein
VIHSMAIVSLRYKYLFLMNPRTACTAVAEVLRERFDGSFLPEEPLVNDSGRYLVDSRHCTLEQLRTHGILDAEVIGSLYKFTAVRNPFDSLVSLYIKQSAAYQPKLEDPNSWVHHVNGHYSQSMLFARDHTFPEWVQWNYGQRQARHLFRLQRRSLSSQFTTGSDFVMRFEKIEADLNQVLKLIGINERVELPLVNDTPGKTLMYRDYYDERSRSIVQTVFAAELRHFGYAF